MKGAAPLVAAAFLWSTIGLATKLALAGGSGPLYVGALRAGVSGALSLAFLRRRVLDKRIALIGVSFTGPLYAVYIFSVMHSGIGIAAVLLYTAPVLVIIAARFLLGEEITSRKIIALILSFSGILLIGLKDEMRADFTALALGIASSLAYSGIILSVRKLSVSGYSPLELGLGPQVWAAVELLPLLAFSRDSMDFSALLPIIYLGVFPSFLAYYLHAKGLKSVEAGTASIISNVEPILALMLGAIAGERFSPLALIGSALVISGAVIASWKR